MPESIHTPHPLLLCYAYGLIPATLHPSPRPSLRMPPQGEGAGALPVVRRTRRCRGPLLPYICLLEGRGIREGAQFELCLQEGRPEVLGGLYGEGGGEVRTGRGRRNEEEGGGEMVWELRATLVD